MRSYIYIIYKLFSNIDLFIKGHLQSESFIYLAKIWKLMLLFYFYQKLQKVGSGVTGVLRLASRRTKRDAPLKTSPVSNIHINVGIT